MKDLIFLHGGNHGSWCWGPTLAELNKTPQHFSRLIALDMPGCGSKRGRDVAGLTLQAIARELNDDLRGTNVGKAVLVGHSIAGVLLPMMALEAPALFSELIHLTTCAPAEGQTVMQMMGTGKRGQNPDEVGFPLDPASVPQDELFRAMFCPDMTSAQGAWLISEVARDHTPPALTDEPVSRNGYDKLGLPTTYILCERDPCLPTAWQRRFAERHSARRIVEIDTPHEPFITHPKLLADTLSRLVAA